MGRVAIGRQFCVQLGGKWIGCAAYLAGGFIVVSMVLGVHVVYTNARTQRSVLMSQKIFICYRRDDASMAGRIGDSLGIEFSHDDVFIDTDKLALGRRFDSELLRSLGESDVFIMVIGRQWLQALQQREQSGQTDFVLEEIKEALRLNLTVIPVLVDGAEFPDETVLPHEIRPVARWQSHEVRNTSFRRDAGDLIDAIHTIRGGGHTRFFFRKKVMLMTLAVLLLPIAWWGLQSQLEKPAQSDSSAETAPNASQSNAGLSTDEVDKDSDVSSSVANVEKQGKSGAEVSQTYPSVEVTDDAVDGTGSPVSTLVVVSADPKASTNVGSIDSELPEGGLRLEKGATQLAGINPELESTVKLSQGIELEQRDDITDLQSDPISRQSKVVTQENDLSLPEEGMDSEQSWNYLVSVFPDSKFSLCGYHSFTAAPVRSTGDLLIDSDDRDIPGQTFPRLKWRVKADEPFELFEGCSAVFSYESLAGGERIHVKVKGE